MTKFWIAVASREHVKLGVAGGFAQVCQGKCSPLQRMQPDDWIVYYSPVEIFGEKSPCRAFTALGRVDKGQPYQHAMSKDFVPWRRDVKFVKAHDAPIEPMIEHLEFIKNKVRWGFPFRRGVFSVSQSDFSYIAAQMGVTIS